MRAGAAVHVVGECAALRPVLRVQGARGGILMRDGLVAASVEPRVVLGVGRTGPCAITRSTSGGDTYAMPPTSRMATPMR